jgi:regulator of sirC expression with transglutaminase-like and TPR domain
MRAFAELAAEPDPRLDLLALALAAEFRDVDPRQALAKLDVFGAELAEAGATTPEEETRACSALLGGKHGFTGDRERYDHPENSMLDVVLSRRRGLPILLSVVYVEAARRAGIALAGVGLPGHFVVGHFGARPPLLLDPFAGGEALPAPPDEPGRIRPWGPHETVMRMLNNLVGSYTRRAHLGAALRAAELRLALPSEGPARVALTTELRALQARLN